MFRVGGAAIEYVAEVPAIGRPNRWLNPAAVADFDGDGRTEIAFVETPHNGGSLLLYEYAGRRLRREQRIAGFSNHAIGAREQDMAAVVDWNGDGVADLALPDAARRAIRVVSFTAGQFRELATLSHDRAIVTAVLSAAIGGRARVVYGLADGRLVVAGP